MNYSHTAVSSYQFVSISSGLVAEVLIFSVLSHSGSITFMHLHLPDCFSSPKNHRLVMVCSASHVVSVLLQISVITIQSSLLN